MFCKNCGAAIAEGQQVCASCGTPVDAPEQNENVNNTPDPSTVTLSNAKPRSKGKAIGIVAAVVALVAIIATAVVLLMPKLKTAFMSEQEKVVYFDRGSVEAGLESLSASIDKVQKETEGSGKFTITVSDALKQQLGASFGDILGDVNSVSIAYDAAIVDGIAGYKLNLMLGETEIAKANIAIDADAGKLFVELPELAESALKLDLSELLSGSDAPAGMFNATAFPKMDKAVISDVLKLVDAFYGAVENVKEEKTTLTVDGVEQSCTVLAVEIDAKMMAGMARALLEQLKKSENIKNYASKLVDTYKDMLEIPIEGDEVGAKLDEVVDTLLTELGELDTDSDEKLTYKMYVNSANEVIGRSIEAEDFALKLLSVQNGKDVAFEYSVDDGNEKFGFKGKGKDNGGQFTGEMHLFSLDGNLLDLKFDGFECDLNNNLIKGSVEISMGKAVSGEAGSDSLPVIGSADSSFAEILSTLKLKLDFDVTQSTRKTNIQISAGNMEIGSIAIDATPDTDYKPTAPGGEVVTDPTEFAGTINIFSIMGKLTEAGLNLEGMGQ